MKWEKEVMTYVKGYNAELCGSYDNPYIDIAIEVEPAIFHLLGLKDLGKIDEQGYLHNEFGTFYLTADGICWFWAITQRKPTSYVKNRVGSFYLTDSETSKFMPRTKLFTEFKKLIREDLDKELERFFKEYSN